jgi:hypothetical protein
MDLGFVLQNYNLSWYFWQTTRLTVESHVSNDADAVPDRGPKGGVQILSHI